MPPPIRPPGSLPELQFNDACTVCGDCIEKCPENIIISGPGGYPEIDFRLGECTFCNACIDVCEEDALSHSVQPGLPIQLIIDDNCLPRHQVVCQSCGDACEADAIRFQPRLGVVSVPKIIDESCTGCGACISACPAAALSAVANG